MLLRKKKGCSLQKKRKPSSSEANRAQQKRSRSPGGREEKEGKGRRRTSRLSPSGSSTGGNPYNPLAIGGPPPCPPLVFSARIGEQTWRRGIHAHQRRLAHHEYFSSLSYVNGMDANISADEASLGVTRRRWRLQNRSVSQKPGAVPLQHVVTMAGREICAVGADLPLDNVKDTCDLANL